MNLTCFVPAHSEQIPDANAPLRVWRVRLVVVARGIAQSLECLVVMASEYHGAAFGADDFAFV